MSADSRIGALDGVRGIAALSVAISHIVLFFAGLEIWSKRAVDFPSMTTGEIVARLLFAAFPGNAAVMVFFVLSGHVLWESFARKKSTLADLPDYAVARVFRLMPLVIVSTIPFGFITDASLQELAANMLLLSSSVNGVLWSLQVEMVGSVLIFAVWILSRGEAWRVVVALIAVAALVPIFRGNPYIVYLPAFVLGALIGYVPRRVWQSRALLCAAAALLFLGSLVLHQGGVTRVVEILAAFALIGCVTVQRPAALEGRGAEFLGAVSYPLYLTHGLGMAAAGAVLLTVSLERFAFIGLYTLLAIAISIVIAWVLHVTIEVPVLRARPRLGRRTGLQPAP